MWFPSAPAGLLWGQVLEAALPAHGFGLIAPEGCCMPPQPFGKWALQFEFFAPFPLPFTSYFPAFKALQPPPSDDGALMHKTVSPILEREISSLWHTMLDELIPSWSMFAGCAWVFLWAGGKGNRTGGANKGERACLQQEALRSTNLRDEKLLTCCSSCKSLAILCL